MPALFSEVLYHIWQVTNHPMDMYNEQDNTGGYDGAVLGQKQAMKGLSRKNPKAIRTAKLAPC